MYDFQWMEWEVWVLLKSMYEEYYNLNTYTKLVGRYGIHRYGFLKTEPLA